MFADYHMHTCFSSDGGTKPEEMVLAALSKGLTEIAITDHVDLDYPPVSYYFFEAFDYNDYFAEISALKDKYAGKIDIVLGVEVGLQFCAKERIDAFFKGTDFEFVIGSTHVVDRMDLYDDSFFTGKEKNAAFMEYFEDLYNSAKNFDMYDVFGHLDCVARYGGYPDKSLDYPYFSDIIDEILKLLISRGKGIEINASGFRYGLGIPHPRREILERYMELGGEIITVGSDAHRPEDVALKFGELYGLLKDIGFKAITSFKGGKPVFVDI